MSADHLEPDQAAVAGAREVVDRFAGRLAGDASPQVAAELQPFLDELRQLITDEAARLTIRSPRM